MLDALDRTELYILILHTLYDIGQSDATKVRTIIETLEGQPFRDTNQHISSLRAKGMLQPRNYNWRTDTFDYTVPEQLLIPTMLSLREKRPNEVVKVMDAVGKELYPSNIQRFVWEFITSDFKKADTKYLSDDEAQEQLEVFVPIVADQRFMPFMMALDGENFFNTISTFLTEVFQQEKIIDIDYVRSLIRSRHDSITIDLETRLLCLCDLYDYMANGRKPVSLYATNKNHRIIAAVHEAYHGNFSPALDHIKKAISLNKASVYGYYTSKNNHFLLSIANFFYLLIAYHSGTEEGRKKSNTYYKVPEQECTVAAKVLHEILYNIVTNKQTKEKLSTLLTSYHYINRLLAVLMSRYIGEKVNLKDAPKWLILRHEMRKYLPLDEETERKANEAYGSTTLLSSIYHRQEWESVLDDLMGISSPQKNTTEKDVRISYIMSDIRSSGVQVRQQTRLKNGSWGAGKQLSMQSFLSGTAEGMTSGDMEIVRQVRREAFYSYEMRLDAVLPQMTEESRLYVGRYAPFTLVEVTEETPYITLHHDDDGFLISSNVPQDGVDRKVVITHRGAASINFIHLTEEQRPYYRRLLSLGHFPSEAEEQLKQFLTAIGGKIEVNSDLIEGGSTLPMTAGSTQLTLQMRPIDKETYSVALFCRPLAEGKIRCTPGEGNETIVDGQGTERTRVNRDLEKERENLLHITENVKEQTITDMASLGNKAVEMPYYDLLPLIEYAQQNPDRLACEWPEGSQMKIRRRNQSSGWSGAIKKTDNGWFEIEGSVELDQGHVVTMAQLLDLASQAHGRFIRLGEGEFLALSDTLRKQLERLNTIASHSRGKLQISPFSAALIGADTLEGELILSEDAELAEIRQRIKDASKYTPRVPKALNATLRNYQKEGFQWMARLNKWGAGALLADDMGLGKTVQTIALLLQKADEGPALVVAPASVAPNWKTELEKFAPSLRITMLNFVGDRYDAIRHARAGEVVVTTYGLLLSVKDEITRKHWTTICLDEAHIIKNRGAKTSAVAMRLHGDNRVMLTGTPLQNHLGELWNLFQFVNPGLLGSFEDFSRRFITPIEVDHDKERQRELDRLVKPFMLRRTKRKVAKELPEKEEIYQHVDMTNEEQLVYEAMRQRAEALLMQETGKNVSVTTLAEITRLRQCACDVRLVDKKETATGSKINALVELLTTIIDSDGRALVFSQFTSYLTLVKKALDEAKVKYLYIDGSVDIKTRTKLVEKFQKGEVPVFLISLKAGGLGLNLTQANYVVHMDPWWNPAIEAQATDRAHRIGQKQSVTVYHLIASGTIEEKIQRLHERKQALVEDILASTDTSHKLTGEELLEMVRQ